MKRCPFCAEEIQEAAIKCRYCGSVLDRAAVLLAETRAEEVAPAVTNTIDCQFCAARIPKNSAVCPSCSAATGASPWSATDEAGAHAGEVKKVRALAESGQKIQAIKYLRERTGWDLRAARDFVEALAGTVPDLALPALTTTVPDPALPAPDDEFADLYELARRGQKDAAIQLLRNRTGWRLEDVKGFIEGRSPRPPDYKPKPSLWDRRPRLVVGLLLCGVGLMLCLGMVIEISDPVRPSARATALPASAPPSAATSEASSTPAALSPAGPPKADAVLPPLPAPRNGASASVRAAVDAFVKQGVIRRMNLQTGSFYVAGDVWEAIELDQKEQMVKIVSLYRDGEFGLPQVRLYESRSGKELAVYGPFTGVTIR